MANDQLGCCLDRIEALSFRNSFDVQIVRGIFEYASAAALTILLFVAPLMLGVDVVSVLIVMAIFVRLFPKVTGLRQCVQAISQVLPAYDALRTIVEKASAAQNTCREQRNRRSFAGPAGLRAPADISPAASRGRFLDQVTVDIPAGAFVAIVGPTGAGKTTLIDCVLGLVMPNSGDVLVDGVPLPPSDCTHGAARSAISARIRCCSAVRSATTSRGIVPMSIDAALLEALDAADASFVLRLPQGLDTDVRHWGSRLSGGERQRIALARALLGTPRLLILDEATSALDVETERNIIDSLRRRRGKTTILAITHRLAVVGRADLIVMMERGRIVDQGSLVQLQAAQGRFATFSSVELEDAEDQPRRCIMMAVVELVLALTAAIMARVTFIVVSRRAAIDHYYWLLAARAYRQTKSLPAVIPGKYLLEDERQFYPPLFGWLLSKFPERILVAPNSVWIVQAADVLVLVLLIGYAVASGMSFLAVAVIIAVFGTAPVLVAYNTQITSRAFGNLFLVACMLSMVAVSAQQNVTFAVLLYVLAVCAAAAVVLTHKMTTQLLLALWPFWPFAFGNWYVLFVPPLGIALAALLTGYEFRAHAMAGACRYRLLLAPTPGRTGRTCLRAFAGLRRPVTARGERLSSFRLAGRGKSCGARLQLRSTGLAAAFHAPLCFVAARLDSAMDARSGPARARHALCAVVAVPRRRALLHVQCHRSGGAVVGDDLAVRRFVDARPVRARRCPYAREPRGRLPPSRWNHYSSRSGFRRCARGDVLDAAGSYCGVSAYGGGGSRLSLSARGAMGSAQPGFPPA